MLPKWIGVSLAVVAGLSAAASAAEGATRPAVYTPDNAPAAPKREDLPLKESVSQYGITWTFGAPAPVGQFLNGDWYVVGPVTIRDITPRPLFGKDVPEDTIDAKEKNEFGGENPRLAEPERQKLQQNPAYCRNGSVRNIPPILNASGFDSRVRHGIYDPNLTARLPIRLSPGDSLVSTISKGKMARSKHYTTTQSVAVLTCLAQPVPADAFRPGYMGRAESVYLARDLRRHLLPKLAPVEPAPKTEELAALFQRPWLAVPTFHEDHAPYQFGGYCQNLALKGGQAALLLCLDLPKEQKEPLLLNLVQMGLDYWAIVRSGHPGWPAWGGWNSGHKLPIVFAGHLLGDQAMANVSRTYPKTSFQEDEQTTYGTGWTGATVLFAGHSGIDVTTGKGRKRGNNDWGPYEHLHPKDWNQDNFQSEAYRRCCTSRAWPGEALAVRLMGLQKQWDHDAFLDYVDRWVMDKDIDANAVPVIAEAAKAKGFEAYSKPVGEYGRHGAFQDDFARAMWEKYRSTVEPPAETWKQRGARGQTTPGRP